LQPGWWISTLNRQTSTVAVCEKHRTTTTSCSVGCYTASHSICQQTGTEAWEAFLSGKIVSISQAWALCGEKSTHGHDPGSTISFPRVFTNLHLALLNKKEAFRLALHQWTLLVCSGWFCGFYRLKLKATKQGKCFLPNIVKSLHCLEHLHLVFDWAPCSQSPRNDCPGFHMQRRWKQRRISNLLCTHLVIWEKAVYSGFCMNGVAPVSVK